MSVTPHLLLEGTVYILIAMAAIWHSRGMTKYSFTLSTSQPVSEASFAASQYPQEEVLQAITKSCLKMRLLGAIILVVAAVVETMYVLKILNVVQKPIDG